MKFQTLPQEILDKIYTYTLVSPSAIIVHSSRIIRTWQKDEGKSELDDKCHLVLENQRDYEATRSSVQDLALAIIKFNRTIAADAASVFYSQNAFSFEGPHDWIPIISWLEAIGKINRGHLT